MKSMWDYLCINTTGYWYNIDGDCYVHHSVKYLPTLDHIGMNKGPDGEWFQLAVACTLPDMTVEEYHQKYCEKRRDGNWYYVGQIHDL